VAGAFISLCQANTRGLTVETTQPTREGRGGKDGVFEIRFVPGVTLQAGMDKSTPISMRHATIDDRDDPQFFIGYRSDGVRIKVPYEWVKKAQRKKLKKTLPVAK